MYVCHMQMSACIYTYMHMLIVVCEDCAYYLSLSLSWFLHQTRINYISFLLDSRNLPLNEEYNTTFPYWFFLQPMIPSMQSYNIKSHVLVMIQPSTEHMKWNASNQVIATMMPSLSSSVVLRPPFSWSVRWYISMIGECKHISWDHNQTHENFFLYNILALVINVTYH